MPRPLVEVRQTVLNTVATVNDPVQQVCLVGLHVLEKTDVTVNTLDRLSAIDSASDLHVTVSANQSFTIDEVGVIINSDIDLGPDQFDLEGDLSIKLASAAISRLTLNDFNNHAEQAVATEINPGSFHEITLGTAFSGITDLLKNKVSVQVQCKPDSTHFNKLVYNSGVNFDFSTGILEGSDSEEYAEIKNLSVGQEIILKDADGSNSGTFIIIDKAADGIFVYGKTGTDHILLTSRSNLVLRIDGADFLSTRFSLAYAGVTESTVVSANSACTVLTVSTPLNFVSVNLTGGGATDLRGKGVLLQSLTTAELSNYIISETDSSNPLVATSLTTGDVTLTINANSLQHDISGTQYQIVKASMTSSYSVALNSNSSSVVTVNANNVESILGSVTPRNQLAVATSLALLNSGGSSVGVLALDLSPADGETAAKSLSTAYTDALVILNKNVNVYAMVPLTQNITTLQAYSNAAEAMSDPKKGKFRICLGTSEGASLVDYIIGTNTSPSTTGSIAGNNISDITNPFRLPSNKVLTGDSVIAVDNAGDTYTGSVNSVTNTLLTITWDSGAPVTLASYYVSRSLANRKFIPRQIELLKATANSIASKRLFLTFPGKCTVSISGNTYSEASAFFVTAAFSGILTRLEIHRPKNFIALAGVTSLANFSRFSNDQLDEISDAGYLVFQQEEPTSAPFCIHQVNTLHGTSPGTQEFTELSVLANFDFVSRYFKEILDPFAGTMNIVPSTFGVIRASLEAGISNLQSRRVSTIGSPLLTGSVDYVRQASYDQGTVEANVSVTIPKVLNRLILEVISG